MPAPEHRGPQADEWVFLASTNRGLEDIAIDEIASITGADAKIYYPGMVRFSASEEAIYRLHARSRSLHRVLVELTRARCTGLAEITALLRELDTPFFLGPAQSFAVRAQRRGEQSFTSMDVEREVGQAIIDEYRESEGTRPPVDLEEPSVIVRLFVRGETVTVTLDATGQRSLHRRQYRVSEHEAPLRPTMAYAMCQYAGLEPGDTVLDPFCGSGTIPIEAAHAAQSRPPETDCDPAFIRFRFLDSTQYEQLLTDDGNRALPFDIEGRDVDEVAVASARENARAAGVADQISFGVADATRTAVDADVVVADMPFGIRTEGDLRSLYDGFFAQVTDGNWRRLVVHTARSDLIPLEPTKKIEMRRGRLETVILVIE